MNKNNIIKIIIASFVMLLVLIYFINLIFRVVKKRDIIKDNSQKIEKLKNNIRTERKNQNLLEKTNKDFLETAYFDKQEDYFENYIRKLFNKYQIKIIIYQSKMDEKDYSEIDLGFNANALTFFKLIRDIEEGEKIIVIKNMRITKLKIPTFKVQMKLGGYYNE